MAAPRLDDSASVAEPEGFGSYWLLERMAEGRLGPVHRACLRREGKPDKLLAIKRIAPSIAAEPGFRERFGSLMGDVANVVHPALCAVEDTGVDDDGDPFVAVEYVMGRDLGRIHAALAHRGQTFPPALVAYIANQVADGLAAAHRATHGGKPAPLLHGELALSDILIGYDGSVRLTGIGSLALAGLVPGLAPRGNRAPELTRGAAGSHTAPALRGDARSDVFSLGACMYELLTGGPALRDVSFSDSAPLPRPQSHITRVVPRALQPIVSRALADQPDARFQSATELGRALRRWSIEQSTPADAAALQAFLHAQLGAERNADEVWLRSALERVPTARESGVPAGARPLGDSATRLRAQGMTPRRALSGPAAAGSTHANYGDLAESTPARGNLMNELAATMSGARSPLEDSSSSVRETMRSELSAVSVGDAGAEWGEHTPVHGWISSSEEEDAQARRAVAESRRASAAAHTPAKPKLQPQLAPVAVAQPQPERRATGRAQLPGWLIVLLAAGVAAAAIAAFSLLRGAPDARLSTLQVQTHPQGAEVFVQGERIGLSPLRLENVASGKIKLELRKTGFENLTRMIELAPAQVFQLDIDLTSRKMAVHSTPLVAAPPPPAEDEAEGEREREANEGSRERRARQESASRWEPRRRREDEGSQARGATPNSASEAAGRSVSEAEGGSTASASAAMAVAPVIEPVAAPVEAAPAAPSEPSPSVSTKATSHPAPAAQPPRGPSRAATAISQIAPRFPARARRAGISAGSVTLEYTVDRTGAVRNPKVVKADPPGMFDDVALGAIEKWRYQPKLDAGKAVDSRVRFTFRFAE